MILQKNIMETIDSYFRYCAEISKDFYKTEYNQHVLHIKNVFKDPYRMLKFQSLISKWESCGSLKPGIMSLELPYWTGKVISDDLLSEFKDINDIFNKVEFLYFYYNNTGLDAPKDDLRTNNALLPHTDSRNDTNTNTFICLINLNNRNVSTAFWKYDKSLYDKSVLEDSMELSEFDAYASKITYDNYKQKTNNGILDKDFEVSYGFNEAIFYDATCFHQAIIDKHWTRENPRIMMRLRYNIGKDDGYYIDQ